MTEDLRKTIDDPDVERSIGLLSGPATEVDDTHSFLPSQSSDSIRYQKLRNHVQGGLGVIFIARDLELNREVALKEIKPAYAKDGTSRNRFVVEAEVTGGLEHPGVVPVYGLGRYEDGRPYYAMRFIKGESLKEAIDRVHKSDEGIDLDPGQRLLALQKLLRRFLDVCNAIEYAHSRGVLHRDLKPKNIMVGQYGETLVVDWGLAKAVGKFEEEEDSPEATLRPTYSSGSTDTIPGSVLGTPQYMSPEQASGRLDQLRPASDVYSLGATLYAILTGKSPFASEKPEEVLPKVQKGEFPKPRQIVKWIDPALESICLKAMALKPVDRYPSARALGEDLERWIADEPVSAYPEPLARRTLRWVKRRRTEVAATAASLLIIAAIGMGGLWWLGRQRAQRSLQANASVNRALNEARIRWGEARKAPPEALAPWQVALASINQANELAAQGDVDAETLRRTRLLDRDFDGEYRAAVDRARQAEVDRTLLAELESIRGARSDERTPSRAEAQYAAAFRKAGLDLEKMDVGAASAWIRSRGNPVELSSYVDDWWFERYLDRQPEPSRRKLVEIAKTADPDPWRNDLRDHLGSKKKDAVATFERLADDAKALDNQPAMSLLMLARSLMGLEEPVRAERVLRRTWARNPGDFWVNFNLALAPGSPGEPWRQFPRPQEAIRFLSSAVALRPKSVVARLQLAAALQANDEYAPALENLREVVRIKPDYVEGYHWLGHCLKAMGDAKGAVEAWRKAESIEPNQPHLIIDSAYLSLENGNPKAALVAAKKAVAINAKSPGGHDLIAQVLLLEGDYDGAIDESLACIRLAPGYTNNAYARLGELAWRGSQSQRNKAFEALLQLAKDYPEIPAYQSRAALLMLIKKPKGEGYLQSVRSMRQFFGRSQNPGEVYEYVRTSLLDPRGVEEPADLVKSAAYAYSALRRGWNLYLLGLAHYRAGEFQKAIGELNELQLNIWPGKTLGWPVLAMANHRLGLDGEAKNWLLKAEYLNPKTIELWWDREEFLLLLSEAETQMKGEFDGLMAAINDLSRTPDPTARIGLAQIAYNKNLHVTANRIWKGVFASSPDLAENLDAFHRYNAACGAALAGCGLTKDDPPPDEATKESLRAQALEWLKADLAARTKLLDQADTVAAPQIHKSLAYWKEDLDLECIRNPIELAKLPKAEQSVLRSFWSELDRVLVKAKDKERTDQSK